jgi:putative methionine-R-sulfoxide reductase with GAF domain
VRIHGIFEGDHDDHQHVQNVSKNLWQMTAGVGWTGILAGRM